MNARKNVMPKTYIIEVTAKQVSIIAHACDVLARLQIGQFPQALEELPLKEYLPNGWNEDIQAMCHLLSKHMKHGINGYNSNLGIYHQEVKDSARVAWDIYRVLNHRRSWDAAIERGDATAIGKPKKGNSFWSVSYDEPSQSSQEPLVKIEEKK